MKIALPDIIDANSQQVTADCEHIDVQNSSSNLCMKDSNVGRQNTVDCTSSLSVVDHLSVSQQLSLPQPVVDIGAETSLQQGDCDADSKCLPSVLTDQCSSDVFPSQPSASLLHTFALPKPVEDIGIVQPELPVAMSQKLLLPQPVEDIGAFLPQPSVSSSQALPQPVEDIGVFQSQPYALPQPVEDISVQISELPSESFALPQPVEDISVLQCSQPSVFSSLAPALPKPVEDISINQSQLSESSVQAADLPQSVVDISKETSSLHQATADAVGKGLPSLSQSEQSSTSICQSQASESATSLLKLEVDTTEQCLKSSLVTADHHRVGDITGDVETDKNVKPSTVIVISARQNKGASASCEHHLECASIDGAESGIHSSSDTDRTAHSAAADLFMCCSDDTVTASESVPDLPNQQQPDTAAVFLRPSSHNETGMISDDTSATIHVLVQKSANNGMRFCIVEYYTCCTISI